METANELATSDLTLTIEHLPHCEVKFTVHAKPSLIAKAKQNAKKLIAKEVSIPGFRKGKAPQDLIEKRFADAIMEKTTKELANMAFKEAQGIAKIDVLNAHNTITYDLKSFDEAEGASMTYLFEIEPTCPSIDIDAVEIPAVEKEVLTEEKLDQEIAHILNFFSTSEEVTNRPAKEGDVVFIDIEDLTLDPPEKVFNQMRFEVSDKGMSEWMKELIIGMNIDEAKEAVSRPNSTDSEEIKAQYTEKKVRVTLHGIQEKTAPALDDALAQKMGVATVEEMKDSLSRQLTNKYEQDYRDKMRDKVCEVLLASYQFDLPKSLIARETEHRLRSLKTDPSSKARFSRMSHDQQQQLQEQIKRESENAIKLFYMMRKVILDNRVKIEMPHPQKDPSNLIEAMFAQGRDQMTEGATEEQKAVMLSKALLTSAQDYIISRRLGV